jgi:hypothetical protein
MTGKYHATVCALYRHAKVVVYRDDCWKFEDLGVVKSGLQCWFFRGVSRGKQGVRFGYQGCKYNM